MNNLRNFAAIDFETANHERCSVCSVGIAIVKDLKITNTFYSLIKPNPEYYLWRFSEIHGLTLNDTSNAPIFRKSGLRYRGESKGCRLSHITPRLMKVA